MPRGTKRASTGSIDLKKRSKRRDSSPSQDVANEEQTQEEKTQQLMKEEERKEFYEKMKQQAAENRGKRLSNAGLHHEAPEAPSRRGRRSTSRSNNPLRSTNTLSVAENKIPAFSSPQSEEIPSKTPAENSSPSMSSNDSQQYNSKSPSFLETDLGDQLYPSIAVSDAFNAIGNMCAAFVAFTNGHEIAGLGFLSVWIAALVGVLRFGVSEKMFCKANQDLANVAGFVGFPVIGMSFVANHYKDLQLNLLMISGFMVALEAFTRSFLDKNRDNARICVNIIFFVAPIAAVCRETADFSTLIALITFVFSGIVITADHEKRIFGVRCVDWFHYSLGVTSYFIACGLGKV